MTVTNQMLELPQIKLMAIFQPYTAAGKLNAVMMPTRPRGFQFSIIKWPGPATLLRSSNYMCKHRVRTLGREHRSRQGAAKPDGVVADVDKFLEANGWTSPERAHSRCASAPALHRCPPAGSCPSPATRGCRAQSSWRGAPLRPVSRSLRAQAPFSEHPFSVIRTARSQFKSINRYGAKHLVQVGIHIPCTKPSELPASQTHIVRSHRGWPIHA